MLFPISLLISCKFDGAQYLRLYLWSVQPFTKSQALIEQSQYTLYRRTILTGHGIICYPRAGVWCWTWMVIVIF